MIREIINFIRSLFCHYDWELVYRFQLDNKYEERLYACKKCHYAQRFISDSR